MAQAQTNVRHRGGAERPRSLLDAVHGQPRLQGAAAADRPRQGHALLHAGGPRGARRRRRACGAPMPATTAIRSCRRSRRRPPSSTSRRPSSSAIRSAFELASRIAALAPGRSRPRVLLQFRLGGGRHRAEDRARLLERARARRSARASSAASAAITASASAAFRSAASSTTARRSARCSPASTICRTTYNREQQAFSKGEPEWGAHLADELERIVALHDASTIAAVIVEPMAGSTGVLPPPKGYLQRLRAICDKYGILLIFDEVITGFGRLGHAFAAERYGVVPDMITFAKGVTSGTVPMGGVIVRKGIHDAFMHGPGARHRVLPRLHLFGASARLRRGARDARPLSRRGPVRARARSSSRSGADAAMTLKGLPNVLDIRCVGLDRRHRSRVAARRRRQARLRGDGARLPRRGPHVPHRRRHDRGDAAADRQREPDRRDLRQGGEDHQGGGVADFPLKREVGDPRLDRGEPGGDQVREMIPTPTLPFARGGGALSSWQLLQSETIRLNLSTARARSPSRPTSLFPRGNRHRLPPASHGSGRSRST